MKKKGISLIVLIITIVVIIILAATIILNLKDTNIISNANEAVVKQDFRTFQEELDLYIANKYAETLGELDVTTVDATTKEEVASIIPSIKYSKYEEYVTIVDGKIVLSDVMPEKEKEWANELGILIGNGENNEGGNTGDQEGDGENNEGGDSGDQEGDDGNNDDDVIIRPTDVTTILPENTIATENSTFTGADFSYDNPVIPTGFKTSSDGATWESENGAVVGWNDGLVIVDESGNEFVWVPCTTDTTDTDRIQYAKRFEEYAKNGSIQSVEDDANALPTGVTTETHQIDTYGGFYISRYEAGVPGKTEEPSNSEGIPVSQRGANVWTDISYKQAMPNAKKLYENNTSVKSGIITGTAWDTTCAWINSETDSSGNTINDVTNSSNWGNYWDTTGDAQYDTDGTTKISGTKQTCGKSEYWKAKNIYDLAGNTWEWTSEYYESDYMYRGGYYNDNGSGFPASYRDRYNSESTSSQVSFRIMLYVL